MSYCVPFYTAITLKKSYKKIGNVSVKYFAESDQLADLYIHSVGFQFGIGTFRDFKPHNL